MTFLLAVALCWCLIDRVLGIACLVAFGGQSLRPHAVSIADCEAGR